MDNQEKKFWNWFVANKELFENILSNVNGINQDEIENSMNLFEENLHQYNENLWFRMGSQNPFELIITAEGNKNWFPFVEKLVENSPKIENWKIISFIQPKNIENDFFYKQDGYELTANDIFFSFSENPSGQDGYFLEIMFYVKDDKFIDDDGFKSSIIRIAETTVGEYDFAKIVGFIDVVPTSEIYAEHESGLLAISQFSQKVLEVKSKICV